MYSTKPKSENGRVCVCVCVCVCSDAELYRLRHAEHTALVERLRSSIEAHIHLLNKVPSNYMTLPRASLLLILPPASGVMTPLVFLSVCLLVCLSVCVSACTCPNITQCSLHATHGLGSVVL